MGPPSDPKTGTEKCSPIRGRSQDLRKQTIKAVAAGPALGLALLLQGHLVANAKLAIATTSAPPLSRRPRSGRRLCDNAP